MGFFTVGNIITLGIVLLILILFRQMDRSNRSRNLIRDYTEKQKKELGEFVKDQERAVKDYAISLNVERDAAKELMKRLQQTEEELAQKAQSMDRIDSQINAYESSLAELERMTSRVQENMNRVRDESAFVEATGKRISEVKNKLADLEKELVNAGKKCEKDLEDIERKFEKENADSLEKAADTVMAGVKSTLSDLRATEETIERKVEEHRLAVIKIEEARAANLARDTEYVDKLLTKAVEQAGKRADKMEEAAVAKLKEQAEDRILKLKTAEEERLRSFQESAKARVLEVQALVKSIREEWRTERGEWETQDKAVRDERKKDLEVFASMFDASKKQMEDFSAQVNIIINSQKALLLKASEEAKQALVKNVREEWRAERGEWETQDKAVRDERKKDLEVFAAKFDASKKQIEDFSTQVNEIIGSQKALLQKEAEETKQAMVKNVREKWQAERSEWETKDKAVRDERKKDLEVFAAMFDASKKQIEDFSARVNEIIGSQESLLLKEAEEMKQTLVKNIHEEWQTERSEWETTDKSIRDERKKDMEVFAAMYNASKKQIEDFSARVNEIIKSQEAMFLKVSEETKQALVKNFQDEWRAERNEWQTTDKAIRDERKKDMEVFAAKFDASKKQIEEFSVRANKIVSSQEALLVKAAEEMKQKALEVNGAKLEEYRRAQDIEFKRLEALADDSRKLDAELRHYMQELIERLKEEFSGYQAEAEGLRKAETENFSLTAARLNGEMTEIEKGLAALKSAAHENITGELKSFENEFLADLTKRSNDIGLRIAEWQGGLEKRLYAIGEDSEKALRKLEHDQAEEMKKTLSAMDTSLVSELDRLKSATGAFEEGILAQMKTAYDSVASFKEQLNSGFEDAKNELQALVDKTREEWRAERSDWETKDKAAGEERKKDLEVFAAKLDASKKQIENFSARANEIIGSQEARLLKAAEEMKQKALEASAARLEEYRRAQDIEFKRLEALADDSRKLDAELRHYMLELIGRLKEEFSGHQAEAEELRKAETEKFSSTATRLEGKMAEIENGLAALKSTAYENITEELKTLESEFSADLTKRSNDIALRIAEWQGGLDKRLSAIGENSETALRGLEHDREEETKKTMSAMNARLVSDLERLKSTTDAFEEGILAQIKAADDSVSSFKEQYEEKTKKTLSAMGARLVSELERLKSETDAFEKGMLGQMKAANDSVASFKEQQEEETKKTLSAMNAHLVSDLERLKSETDAFEKGILGQMKAADDSVASFKEQLDSGFEEAKIELQAMLDNVRQEWRVERSDWETKDKATGEERKKDLEAFAAKLDASKKQIDDFSTRINEIISSQEARLLKAAEEMKQKALEVNAAKLEEYHRAQDIEFRRLEALADDSRKLDAELRHYMQELIERLKEEFSGYQSEAEDLRKAETENFSLTAARLNEEMTEIEKGLAALKSTAYENITEELKTFENEFSADLTKRNNDIGLRITEWQGGLEKRLSAIGESSETALRKLEHDQAEEMKKTLSAMDARLASELEHLKSETGAFEEGILGQMKATDDSVSSFKEQLDRGLKDARKEAEISIKAEIGNYSITAAETVKKYQRELDDAWNGLSARLRELDDNVEEAHQRIRDLAAETDTRIASVRSSVEDAERHIREAREQTKIIDVAKAMKLDMERSIEDLKVDIDRLDQRRAEAAKLENEFIKIKHHEDDINAKYIKILSEERRIENMEANFNRFLQISRSVEEKLADVTASNDTLLGVQLQIRKLEEALGNTEERYQRLEKKNQILDNTNDGIDRNFKALQDTEKLSDKIGGELVQYADELERIRTSIEKLSAESEKAENAVDRIDVLKDALEQIEERITSMQRARQWIADAETRLEELNRQAQTQVKAIDSLVVKGKKSRKTAETDDGTLSEQKKRDIVILAEQGWTVEQIAKAEKVSIGVVQLVLEMAPRERD
jgi:DNA repair exonuclease SbcCD ATPase subunit